LKRKMSELIKLKLKFLLEMLLTELMMRIRSKLFSRLITLEILLPKMLLSVLELVAQTLMVKQLKTHSILIRSHQKSLKLDFRTLTLTLKLQLSIQKLLMPSENY